jgi:protein O-GlcNAc transferase
VSGKSRTAKRNKPHKPSRNLQSSSERAAALTHAGKLQNAGDLAGASTIYRQILARDPANENALFLSGLLEHERGDQHGACVHFERLIKLRDADAEYRLWYARVLRAMGDSQRALAEVRRSRALRSEQESAYHIESLILRDLGLHLEALDVLRAGVVVAPRSALLHSSLGETYLVLRDLGQARAFFEHALELDGSMCSTWINLGLALQADGHSAAATLAFEQALRIEPNNADAHYNFAVVLENENLLDRAIMHAHRAAQLRPERGDWQTGLAGLLSQVCEFDAALSLYRSGLALRPDPLEHSSLIALQQYLPSQASERLPEARRWADLYVNAPAPVRSTRPRAPGPLRVGYVSADFRQHSVCYFFEPLLAAHDLSRVAVTCYVNSTKTDAVTERLAQRATMRSIKDLTDAQVVELIENDGIDVLVELSGHTLGHRLRVFGRSPAPLQLAYLGYPGTTGVPAIRYRLTDPLVDPAPLGDAFYSEQLYRLPRVFCCFQPPPGAPSVGPLPARARGQITFGSLNKYMKVTDPVIGLWTQVMHSVPNSRLVLQSSVFADPAVCAGVRERFMKRGIAAERIELFGAMPLAEHLALYQQIDIGLDTHPWNGHTTTCLALHMGVPVLALAGDVGASRMGVSVLSAAGLADWVAADEAAYVQAAQRWSSELGALAELRDGLRVQLQRSALCDGPTLAAEVEDAYFALGSRAACSSTDLA